MQRDQVSQPALQPVIRHDQTGLLAAGLTVLVWASSFPAISIGLRSYSPEGLALLRYLIASGLMGLYMLWTRQSLPPLRDWPRIAMVGFLGITAYNLLLNQGQVGVSAGIASFIIASDPVYMSLMTLVLWNEKLNRWGWLGILISMVGVGVISLGREGGLYADSGVFLIMLAAIAKAAYSIIQRPYLPKYGALRLVTYAIWAGTVFLLPFAPNLADDLPHATRSSTLAIIFLAIFPGLIGYISWSLAISRLPIPVAGSFLYFIPPGVVLVAWLWIGEVPSPMVLVGGVFILMGVILIQKRGKIT